MKTTMTHIEAKDGLALHTYQWMPENDHDLKAILLLIHGSVEHAGRYEAFGEYLTQKGVGVFAFDMRGHGHTTDKNSKDFAHIAYQTGWQQLLEDMAVVHEVIKQQYPQTPRFLFGHSMGSFLVRDYVAHYSSDFAGLILSGTTYGDKKTVGMLLKVVKLMTIFYPSTHKSKFIHGEVYDKLNQSINQPKTSVDFISSDPKEVQKYLADDLSGATISLGYAYEMGKGLLRARDVKTIQNTPHDLPIFIVSGSDDPLAGTHGSEVIHLYQKYKAAGVEDIKIKLYKGARHELLNDVVRTEAMHDMWTWMCQHTSAT